MLVLGIDPGIGRCGFGLISVDGPRLKAVEFGCIETEPNSPIEERLLILSRKIRNIIKKNKPDALAIEDLFFGANGKTAFAVGQARGVVLLAAAEGQMSIAVYTPLQVKMAVTGYGRADKNQMGQMIKVILKLEKIPKLDDTSDALAVAVTHAFSAKMNNQLNS